MNLRNKVEIFWRTEIWKMIGSYLSPPVEAVAAATSVHVHVFIHWTRLSRVSRRAHNSQISSTFQEADCLLKLVKINKQVFAITLLSRNLNHAAELSISARLGK